MRPGAEPLDAEAVRAFASGKLAHYKAPRYVLVVDEFPDLNPLQPGLLDAWPGTSYHPARLGEPHRRAARPESRARCSCR